MPKKTESHLSSHTKKSSQSPILSAVGVVRNEDGQILITKRKVAPFLGQWVMPGGKAQFGESITDTVRREIEEEVGVQTTVARLLSFKESLPSAENKFRHYFILYFDLLVSGPMSIRIDPAEVEEIAWVAKDTYSAYDLAPKAKEVLDEIFAKPKNSPGSR